MEFHERYPETPPFSGAVWAFPALCRALTTHSRKCFDDVLGSREATKLLRRVEFHYTPKHASWLNMAEIEIGILSRQCLDRRIANA